MRTLLLLPLCLSGLVHADEAYRCGKWVVTSSMSVAELLNKCGAPNSRETKSEDVLARHSGTGAPYKVGTTTTETWRYQRSSQAQPMIVTIVDGKIRSLEY